MSHVCSSRPKAGEEAKGEGECRNWILSVWAYQSTGRRLSLTDTSMKRLLIFSVLALSASLSQSLAQAPTKPEKDVPKAKETSDSRIPSATALGDIFFKSQNSFIFSMGVQGSATDNLYFSPAGSFVGVPAVSDSNGYIPFAGLSGRIAYQRQLQRSTFGLDYGVTGMFFNGSDSGDYLKPIWGNRLKLPTKPANHVLNRRPDFGEPCSRKDLSSRPGVGPSI